MLRLKLPSSTWGRGVGEGLSYGRRTQRCIVIYIYPLRKSQDPASLALLFLDSSSVISAFPLSPN